MASLALTDEVEQELARYKQGSQSILQLLTRGPFSDAAFDVLGSKSAGRHYRIAYIPQSTLDDFLYCASRTRDPRAGFRHCARQGIELREIKTAPASRGEALLLGLSNNERNNTDGDRCNSIALRRAGYEALHGRINLYGDDVQEMGFHLRLLSAMVKMGYFTQDRRTYVVTRGRVLLEFHRLHPRCNMTGSDAYYLLTGISVGSGLRALGSSIACCWAGV